MTLIRQLNTSGISHRCSKEQRMFLNKQPFDPRYCYELLRRALREADQSAWTHVLEIFTPLVSNWVLRHSDFAECGEDAPYFVQGAFVRLWSALSGDNFDESRDLSAILLYLKRCVHSEIVDHLRRERFPTLELDDYLASTSEHLPDPIAVEKLWAVVHGRLKDEKERIVVYASFFLAYQPREIFNSYKAHFSSVGEVHRIKERVIERLKRVPDFKDLFEFDA